MEYPSIFPAGFHDISETDFSAVFVIPFQDKTRRQYLSERFFALIERFKESCIPAEVWIDGSFSTLKPDPNDIDVLFFVDSTTAHNLTSDKQAILNELNERNISKARYQCDVFIILNNNPNYRSYWRGWFGFSRDEVPKGIVRLFIN